MKSNIIYCIPGLGLNRRIFEKLEIPSATFKFIDFIPVEKGEKIENYALRLSEQITDKEFSLLGMSLGGILAIEISKIKISKQLFLISTIINESEKPKFLDYLDFIPSNDTIAAKIAVKSSVKLKPYYDNSDAEGVALFKEMLEETPYEFITWGWKAVSTWKNSAKLEIPFYHLHGTADLVFPIKNIDQAETVKGGTHYMIYNNSKEISERIEKQITNH